MIDLFVTQVTARTAVDLMGIHRNSAVLNFPKLRQCIAARMAEVEPEIAVFGCSESDFGGVRKGKRGRGAAGEVCVFGSQAAECALVCAPRLLRERLHHPSH
ncbi:hypothetical protein GLA29479_5126 [Lysobacter antibioticus]|uniref:hypothetical protein n=1 Tax=Lysobacter antibioticus TaxID=84531 RepID=UPI000716F425|nr:hypothetical protein [Lysobacter antibioticus]ALN65951.1 hypothetical protein GLA29479_5126 [Lysobacter antibioticus]